MYDKKVLHLLDKIIESVEVILERTETVDSVNAFLDSSTGTLLLDGVCMKLIAVGESIKNNVGINFKIMMYNNITHPHHFPPRNLRVMN